MLKRCLLTVCLLLCALNARAQSVDPNFVLEFLHFGNGVVSLRFDGAGNLYATEKVGRLLRFPPDGGGGFLAPVELLDITAQVDAGLERGLLGMELDPDFGANRRVFLLYSTPTDQRVVAYTVNPSLDGVEPGSEVLLLTGLPNQAEFHKAGDLGFSPDNDNLLFVALGDDGLPGVVDDPDRYEGKMLRIDKITGEGAADNPFFDGDFSSVRSRVWATGLRNPFRFTFHPDVPVAEVLYSSENGDGTDRISWIRRGSDGHWDEGGDGFIGCPGGCFLDPADPDHRVMVRIEPSQIGIAIATQGPFAVGGEPTLYSGNWFPSPFFIRRWTLSGPDLDIATPLDSGQPFYDNLVAIDLTFGPDGCLYLSDAGVGAGDGSIQRICFVGGQAPVSSFTTNPSPPRGAIPLDVTFTDSSTDDGTIVSRQWDFGDGNGDTAIMPSHQYAQAGEYTVTLTVTDDSGLMDTAQQVVTAFSDFSLDLTVSVLDAGTLPPAIADSPVVLSFYRLDAQTPLPVPGGVGGGGNERTVPASTLFNEVLDIELVDPGLVLTVAEPLADGFSFARLGLPLDTAAGAATVSRTAFLAQTVISGQVLATTGPVPIVDVGVHGPGGAPYAFGGGRDHLTDPTGVDHRVDVDGLGYFHVPLLDADGSGDWTLETPGDTNANQFGRVVRVAPVIDGQTREESLLLGVFDGGTDCDDLSGIPEMLIGYAPVQALWTSQCTGCHTAVSPNSGGLDLTDGSLGRVANGGSSEAPGVPLVSPGDESRSYLFEKVNCATPQVGSRMRPTNAMDPDQQALIRDWIRNHVHFDSFEDN